MRGDEADVDQDGAGRGGGGRGGGAVFVVVVVAVVAVIVASSSAAALFIAALLSVGDPGAQQLGQAAPGVVLGVRLEEVVLAAVARQLELGADLGLRWKSNRVRARSKKRNDEREKKLVKKLTLYIAPAALACSIDLLTRSRLPSKSSAHWFRLQVASVAMRRGMVDGR